MGADGGRLTRPVRVLVLSAELAPYAKTGGLGDAVASLCRGLAIAGCEVLAVVPAYADIDRDTHRLRALDTGLEVTLAGQTWSAALWRAPAGATMGHARVVFLDIPSLFRRGGIYGDPEPYADNALRFGCYVEGALEAARALGFAPDVIHAHDWHAALAPLFAALRPRWSCPPRTVLTVHNLAYQGLFGLDDAAALDIPTEALSFEGLEFFGQLSLLKAGLLTADIIAVSSPSEAARMLTPEGGMGLDGVLRARREALFGISPGTEESDWDPARDPALSARFSANSLRGKLACKLSLQRSLGLRVGSRYMLVAALFAFADEREVERLAEAIEQLRSAAIQVIVAAGAGAGEKDAFRRLRRRLPGRIALEREHDAEWARHMCAGADVVLTSSNADPGGISKLYAQRYGALPLDLGDRALEDATSLAEALERAESRYRRRDVWNQGVSEAMRSERPQSLVAAAYVDLFARARSADLRAEAWLAELGISG